MIRNTEINDKELRNQIKQNIILFGGNSKLKIYGQLNCASGKRMKKENRMFFVSAEEATNQGFRPCGNCMKSDYKIWKNETV